MFPFQKDRSLSKAWQTARVGASIPAYTLRSEPGTGEEASLTRNPTSFNPGGFWVGYEAFMDSQRNSRHHDESAGRPTSSEPCHCRDDAAAHSKLQCMGGMVCLLTELPRGSIVPPSSSRT